MENQAIYFHICSTESGGNIIRFVPFTIISSHHITGLTFIKVHVPIPLLMQMKSTCQSDQGSVSLLLMTLHMSKLVDFNLKLFFIGFHASLLQCSTSSYWLT